jgi:asparaginyl-tRNA synthetase
MQRTRIKEVLAATSAPGEVRVQGWVRTRRESKAFSFLEVNDGSCLASLQVVYDATLEGYGDNIPLLHTGAAVDIIGLIVTSQGKGQTWELQAQSVAVVGAADETYPLQKKRHTREFLREIAHLRPRTNLFGAVFRIRSRLAYAIHRFFQERGFVHVHTPIITASDCEGAGEMFRVTTLEGAAFSAKDAETRDFFGKRAYLTVSGQLEGETFACAFSDIYTFGPTFRAENSNTSRHAAEFWMIEPEMAFCDLTRDMETAEALIQELIRDALEHCAEDLAFCVEFVDKTLGERLQLIANQPFARISYTEAVEILLASGKSFEYPVVWGHHLQTEHERFLSEEHVHGPVTIYNYPVEIKPFYMRQNEDGKTVAAMDLLVPGIGEIVGGSQREERLDRLSAAMVKQGLKEEDYWWYLDLRRYGSAPHAGFGLGFERLIMLVTGVENIRDVIPFPRTPRNADF